MGLGRQWEERITIWLDALKNQFYHPIGEVNASAFFTMERLSVVDAKAQAFSPIAKGTPWGKKWEYGWFQCQITLQEQVEGKRVVCFPKVGPETLVWMNGQAIGSIDRQHSYFTLSRSAKAGDSFNLLMESYAGHGGRNEGAGPCPPEMDPLPEPPMHQTQVGSITYGTWNEDAYQLYMDAFVLWDLYQVLDPKSLRAEHIAAGLKKFTLIADVELSEPMRTESFIKAREELKALLECVNGSTAPTMTIFGQSHLDLAWLWPWNETRRKVARTYTNQLTLMAEYPEYRFLLCEPILAKTLQNEYPDVYARVLENTKAGKFFPEGGMWVESDTNIPTGECLVRQILKGKQWFRENLNTDTRMLWLPDTFGFSASLPQIMKLCHIEYFATQKLLRADPECEAFPFNIFWWEGMDGSRILSHIFKKNNAVITPKQVWERWYKDRNQEENIEGMVFPFGYGDGGGGPTRDMLEVVSRIKDLEGLPRTKMESPIDFFERIDANEVSNTYQGELYLAWHRGTYTSQGRIKVANRRAEQALRNADFWSTILLHQETTNDLWNRLLFQQFHDILPGTSIACVNDEAIKELEEISTKATKIVEDAAATQSKQLEDESSLLNSLSWDRMVLFKNSRGKSVLTKVKGCSITSVKETETVETSTCHAALKDVGAVLENDSLFAVFDSNGEITSVTSKASGREFIMGHANTFHLYKDVNTCYDAWEMGRMVYDQEIAIESPTKIEVEEDEGCIASLKITKTIGNSTLEQRVSIIAGESTISFETNVDWHERHRLLKVGIETDMEQGRALFETQYGYVERHFGDNHPYERDQYEVPCQKYCAITDSRHCVAVLNNGKYGVNVACSAMLLSLLRAPLMPDKRAEEGKHSFTYAFLFSDVAFEASEVTRKAYELNSPCLLVPGKMESRQLFDIESASVILDWVKMSETSDSCMLVRLYQSICVRETAKITIHFPVKRAWEVDFTEETKEELQMSDQTIQLEWKPFEIKTIKLEFI